MSILLIIDIIIIVTVLAQNPKSSGMSALTSNAAETFFGKNKTGDLESKLNTIVKITGICFVVLSLLLTMLINFMD